MVKPELDKSPTREHEVRREAPEIPTERSIEISIALLMVLLDTPWLREQRPCNFHYTTRGLGQDRKAYIIFNTVNNKLLWLLSYGEYL